MKNKVLYIQILLIVLALIGTYNFFKINRSNYNNWMAPYLSAAHNLEWGGTFRINVEECTKFQQLTVEQQDQYKFSGSENLSHYNHNPIGYAYIIKFATTVFPFLGDQMSILVLQCLFHLLISILFLTIKEFSIRQKWLFFILYAINPLILRWAPINYYYFWQVIPSVIFVYLIICKKPNKLILLFLFIILPFTVLTRPTILFSLPFVFFLLFKRKSLIYLSVWSFYVVLICITLFQPIKKNFWHTVYVGFGAYNNNYGIESNDDWFGYELYQKETGEKLNVLAGGNYYQDEVIKIYTKVAKIESLKIIKSNPIWVLKNAIVNTLEGYSIGFINRGDWLNYLIAFTGLIFVILMIYNNMYIWFLMIGFSIGTFTLYYPPQGSYMFGVYLISVSAFIQLPFVVRLLESFKKKSEIGK